MDKVLSFCVGSEEENAPNIGNSHGMKIQTIFLIVTLQNAACGCGRHCCPHVNLQGYGQCCLVVEPQ